MKVNKLRITTKSKKYSIFIGRNLINNINNILRSEKLSFKKILLVIDKNVPSKFKKKLLKNIKTQSKKHLFLILRKKIKVKKVLMKFTIFYSKTDLIEMIV